MTITSNLQSNLQTNLQALYKADFVHLPETVLRDLEATEEIQQLRYDIKTNVQGSNWSLIRTEILSQMQQLLDIELESILIDSWKTHQDVSREIDSQKEGKSDEITIVSLTEHEIKSTHSPSLSINIENHTHLMRTFIGITLQLQDVMLKIQHGEIIEVLSGVVTGKGFMQYQNATLIERDFLAFDIAGKTTVLLSKEEKPLSIDLEINDPQTNKQPLQAPPQNITNPPKKQSVFSKLFQFIIGISLALVAMYLFWKYKMG